jgi:hypothetical protein
MIVNAPFTSPAPPIPATAREIISILEDVDTAQSSEPSSKMAKKERKTDYISPGSVNELMG